MNDPSIPLVSFEYAKMLASVLSSVLVPSFSSSSFFVVVFVFLVVVIVNNHGKSVIPKRAMYCLFLATCAILWRSYSVKLSPVVIDDTYDDAYSEMCVYIVILRERERERERERGDVDILC